MKSNLKSSNSSLGVLKEFPRFAATTFLLIFFISKFTLINKNNHKKSSLTQYLNRYASQLRRFVVLPPFLISFFSLSFPSFFSHTSQQLLPWVCLLRLCVFRELFIAPLFHFKILLSAFRFYCIKNDGFMCVCMFCCCCLSCFPIFSCVPLFLSVWVREKRKRRKIFPLFLSSTSVSYDAIR